MSVENWSRSQKFAARTIASPKTLSELSALVQSADRMKVMGSLHCFNTILDPQGSMLVCLKDLDVNAPVLDLPSKTVTVGGCVTYGTLANFLLSTPFALPNMASLPHISVAGAVGTATHGSGTGNGCLSSAVVGLEFVRADGRVEWLRADDVDGGALLRASVVHLGCLGVVTRLTLTLVDAFELRQDIWRGHPWASTIDSLDEILEAGYSVSLFTDFSAPLNFSSWRKTLRAQMPDAPPKIWFGGALETTQQHPIAVADGACCTAQGEFGAWSDRLPHFRLDFTPSVGEELQAEYNVAREDARDALRALEPLAAEIAPLLYISELRAIACDDLGLSPFSGRHGGSLAIHFTWKPMPDAVMAILPKIEAVLQPFCTRPHWGKLFTMDRDALLRAHGENAVQSFKDTRLKADPTGKFVNSFIINAGLAANL